MIIGELQYQRLVAELATVKVQNEQLRKIYNVEVGLRSKTEVENFGLTAELATVKAELDAAKGEGHVLYRCNCPHSWNGVIDDLDESCLVHKDEIEARRELATVKDERDQLLAEKQESRQFKVLRENMEMKAELTRLHGYVQHQSWCMVIHCADCNLQSENYVHRSRDNYYFHEFKPKPCTCGLRGEQK